MATLPLAVIADFPFVLSSFYVRFTLVLRVLGPLGRTTQVVKNAKHSHSIRRNMGEASKVINRYITCPSCIPTPYMLRNQDILSRVFPRHNSVSRFLSLSRDRRKQA